MKILLLSNYSLEENNGPGIILRNTKNYFDREGIYNDYKQFRINSQQIEQKSSQNIDLLPRLTKPDYIRALFGSITKNEEAFINKNKQYFESFTVIILFASFYDPILERLIRGLKKKIIFHPNDSIYRFEKNRKKKRNLYRRIIAKKIEGNILKNPLLATIYVSRIDREIASSLIKSNKNHSNLFFLPLAVNQSEFYPRNGTKTNSRSSSKIIALFTGNLDYGPNRDACLNLILNIAPKLSSKIEVHIVGRNPSNEIITLGNEQANIVVKGYVCNLAEEIRNSDIYICPTRSGAGMKFKILEAMSSGLPVISSLMEKNSFRHDIEGVLFAKENSDLIFLINLLAGKLELTQSIGKKARNQIEMHYCWEQRNHMFLDLIKRLCIGSV